MVSTLQISFDPFQPAIAHTVFRDRDVRTADGNEVPRRGRRVEVGHFGEASGKVEVLGIGGHGVALVRIAAADRLDPVQSYGRSAQGVLGKEDVGGTGTRAVALRSAGVKIGGAGEIPRQVQESVPADIDVHRNLPRSITARSADLPGRNEPAGEINIALGVQD